MSRDKPANTAEGRRHPVYTLYRVGAGISSIIPEGVLFPAAQTVGLLAGRVHKGQRAVVRRNLARVVASDVLERTVDAAYRSYARYWMETLRIPRPGRDELRRRTTVEGLAGITPYRDEGRGVVFVTPHLGNWDLAGAWLASQGWRVLTVAEELEPPELFDLFVRLREAVGVEVFPLGQASSARRLLSGLQGGAALGLVADRDLTGSGIDVEFFGERTSLPTGPAVLAMRAGAVIAPGALYQRPGGRYAGKVLEPIPVPRSRGEPDEVRRLTQQVAHALEELIRADPGQWHLFQPNWPSDPGYRAGS